MYGTTLHGERYSLFYSNCSWEGRHIQGTEQRSNVQSRNQDQEQAKGIGGERLHLRQREEVPVSTMLKPTLDIRSPEDSQRGHPPQTHSEGHRFSNLPASQETGPDPLPSRWENQFFHQELH